MDKYMRQTRRVILSLIVFMGLGSGLKAMPLKIDLQIPYGEDTGLILAYTHTSALLEIENQQGNPVEINLKLSFPSALNPSVPIFEAHFFLPIKHAKWFKIIDLYPQAPGRYSIRLDISCLDGGREKQINLQKTIQVLAPSRLQKAVCLKEIYLPADAKGQPLKAQRPWCVVLRSSFLKKQEGITPPTTYLGLRLSNNLNVSLPLIVRLQVCDPKTGKRIAGFDPQLPPGHGGITLKGNYRLVSLPPKQTLTLALPVYGDAEAVKPGCYQAKLTLKLLGTDLVLTKKSFALTAIAYRQMPFLNTCLALALDFILLLGLVLKRHWLKVFKLRQLMTITLFGATIFAAVNLPGHFLFQLAHLVLGPFAFFVTGLFYEVVFYILLVALVWLVPRPGAATLAILMRSLLNDLLFGSFTPASLIALGPYALLLEAAFYLSGLTRRKRPTLRLAFFLGLADAAITYITLNLFMALYRLYYADWYIWLYLIVPGFLYTFFASFGGIRLGQRLKGVEV